MNYETAHVYNHCIIDGIESYPREDTWDELSGALGRATERMGVFVHSFVLMSNHFHLLLSGHRGSVATAMDWLLEMDSARWYWPAGWNGKVNYYLSAIAHPKQYRTVFKYIALNPVMAGLAHRVEGYPFSTVHARARGSSLPFSLCTHPWSREGVLDLPVDDKLEWLNERRPFVPKARASLSAG